MDNSSGGIRHSNIIKHLNSASDLTVLNLVEESFLFSSNSLIVRHIGKLIRKLPLLPDPDVLIVKRYKRNIKKLFLNNKYNTVIIGVIPFSFLMLTKFIKEISYDTKVIVDMTDPITCNARYKSYSLLKRKHLRVMEKKYFRYIDTLIVLNQEIKEFYQNQLKEAPQIIVIEQGFDEKWCFVDSKPKNKSSLKLLYAGYLYKNIREPFELYHAVNSFDGKIFLSVFGSIKSFFKPPSNDRFFFGGKISFNRLIQEYDKSGIIVFIDNRDSLQIPGKIYEILALNKPILFLYYNENSPTIKLISGFDGIYFSKNEKNEIQKTLHLINSSKNFYYKRDLSEFFWRNILLKFNEII